jgi:hypothetical protein
MRITREGAKERHWQWIFFNLTSKTAIQDVEVEIQQNDNSLNITQNSQQ